MSSLELPRTSLAWELRGYWGNRTVVTVTLSEACIIRTVVGPVAQVSVTGAFAVVDGWHLPVDEILRVARATVEDKTNYQAAAQAAKERMRNDGC